MPWILGQLFALGLILISMGHSASAQDNWLDSMREINPTIVASFEIDEGLVRAAGIQKIPGQHIDLYTDVRESEKVDELVGVFDESVNQWCAYFKIEPDKAKHWKIRAFLIADEDDPSRFQQAGLMPDHLPSFKAGFQRQHDLWLYLQPGNYYTRHLLIHEGTHAFMLWFLRGYGSPWYGEGMAELFGVHRWNGQKLELLYRLRDRSESENWGRVKQIKDERDAGTAMSLSDVLNIPPTAFLDVRFYAWSWAGCEFFAKHEKTKVEFAKLPQFAGLDSTEFNQQFGRRIQNNWVELERDWVLFVAEMEYGYEIQRGSLSQAHPVEAKFGSMSSKFRIASNRSWQSTKVKIKKGDRVRITGSGEFIVADDRGSRPWGCQSNGVTIRYYQGHPLGMLQAGILNPGAKTAQEQVKALIDPIPVGFSAEIIAPSDGILCLRINESPAFLDDNQGALEVTVEKLK